MLTYTREKTSVTLSIQYSNTENCLSLPKIVITMLWFEKRHAIKI